MSNTKKAYCWVEVWDMDYKNRSGAGYIDNSTNVLTQLIDISGPFDQWLRVYLCHSMQLGQTSHIFHYDFNKNKDENKTQLNDFIKKIYIHIFDGNCTSDKKFHLVIIKTHDQSLYNVDPDFVKDSELAGFLTSLEFTKEDAQMITRYLNITEVWQLQNVSDENLVEVDKHLNVEFVKKLKVAVLWSRVEFEGKSLKWTGNPEV